MLLWATGDRNAALLFVVLALLVFYKHHANIARLLAGTEPKIRPANSGGVRPKVTRDDFRCD